MPDRIYLCKTLRKMHRVTVELEELTLQTWLLAAF